MKFAAIAIVSALIAPLAYAAALSPANINALAARDTDSQNFEDVVGYALPDGTRKIDFYLNGALEGSAVETKDGGMLETHTAIQPVHLLTAEQLSFLMPMVLLLAWTILNRLADWGSASPSSNLPSSSQSFSQSLARRPGTSSTALV